MDRAKRIEQYFAALKWCSENTLLTTVKLEFDTHIDTLSQTDRDNYNRFIKINDDISEIYMTGTEEEKMKIDEIINKIDKLK